MMGDDDENRQPKPPCLAMAEKKCAWQTHCEPVDNAVVPRAPALGALGGIAVEDPARLVFLLIVLSAGDAHALAAVIVVSLELGCVNALGLDVDPAAVKSSLGPRLTGIWSVDRAVNNLGGGDATVV